MARVALVVSAVGLVPPLVSTTPAGAEPGHLSVFPASGPPGSAIHVSGGCFQPTGTFTVTFEGAGGSYTEAVPAPHPGGSGSWSHVLQVPWSTLPGPATISATCAPPTSDPVTFTVAPPASAVPPAVPNVVVTPGGGYVTARWSPPDVGGPFWAFSVIATSGGALVGWVNVPGGLYSASVPVPNGVPIDVYVVATNTLGPGALGPPASTTASATNPGPGPASPPQHGGYGPRGSSGLTVFWDPPAFDGGSPILGYHIAAVRAGTTTVDGSSVVGPELLTGSVEGLQAGAYDVYVAALTAVGYGVPKHVQVDVQLPAEPVRPPSIPMGIAVAHGAGGTVVRWRPPEFDNGSPVAAYSIVATQDGQVVAWSNAGPLDRSTTLSGLVDPLPATQIHVLALNGAGYGPALTTRTGG